jgi:hypothetical protein
MNVYCYLKLIIFSIIALAFQNSFAETCGYQVKEIPLSTFFANSTIVFVKTAEIVRGTNKERHCAKVLGNINNLIAQEYSGKDYAHNITNAKIETITPKSKMKLKPIMLLSVSSCPSFIDHSGSPIEYIVLKNQKGELFQVATVELGTNKGEEFLKAVNGKNEILLDARTKFSK